MRSVSNAKREQYFVINNQQRIFINALSRINKEVIKFVTLISWQIPFPVVLKFMRLQAIEFENFLVSLLFD